MSVTVILLEKIPEQARHLTDGKIMPKHVWLELQFSFTDLLLKLMTKINIHIPIENQQHCKQLTRVTRVQCL